MDLDQFYTREDIAARCWKMVCKKARRIVDWEKAWFVEPSAGSGAFLSLMPPAQRAGYDIAPQCDGITQADFLSLDRWDGDPDRDCVVVGNPPFGKRGRVALDFFSHASKQASIIAFIVPYVFTRWEIHKKIPEEWRLIHEDTLPVDSFVHLNGRPCQVGTVFQIWTHRKSRHRDLRVRQRPPVSHPDFKMLQYNNTLEARKLFKLPFDFGVPCQGWQDYGRRETNEAQMERSKQWMLFEAMDGSVREILDSIDYHALAHTHTTTVPGFRKSDVVAAYEVAR